MVHVIDSILVPENFKLQEVDDSGEMPETGDIGLAPFALAGLVSLIGAGLLKRKVR